MRLLKSPILAASVASVVAALMTSTATAAIVTLTTGDSVGTSSFNSAGHWSDGNAPSAANDYVNPIGTASAEVLLRTPGDAANYTFGGNSLTLNTNGTLIYKGTGSSATPNVYTINNLHLNGGLIRSGAGSTNVADFAGSIIVDSAASTIRADQSSYIIDAPITGSTGLGVATTDSTSTNPAYTITFNSSINLAGNLDYRTGKVANSLIFSPTSAFTFNVGASGVNNEIISDAANTVAGTLTFNGAFNLNLASASTAAGSSWTLIGANLTPTYGATFTIPGFAQNGTTWSNGTYSFDQTTGVLSVAAAPEPASLCVLGLGAAGLLLRKRHQV